MTILSLLQCAFIVYKEKYRKEKEKLLEEIKNLKKAMNHMFIQIQLMKIRLMNAQWHTKLWMT